MTEPIRMIYQQNETSEEIEVDVYDFLHNSETFDTFAVCWIIKSKYWITVPIWMVKPKIKKKQLKEKKEINT